MQYSKENPKNYGTAAFFYNPEKKEVLLHLRDGNTNRYPNKWSFFGGSLEGNESKEDGCLRELKEELDIDIPKNKLIFLREYYQGKHGVYHYIFYVETDLPKSAMTLGEGADFDWFPVDKVFDLDLSSYARDDLKYFFKKI